MFEKVVSTLDQMTEKLDKILGFISIILLGVIAICVNIGIFYRYVLTAGLPWSEEIPKFGMVWMGFIGTSMALRRDQHIGFHAVKERLSVKYQFFFKLLSDFLILFLLIMLIRWGFYLAFTIGPYSVTPQLNISYFWLLQIVPISGILMMLQLIMKILRNIIRFFEINE